MKTHYFSLISIFGFLSLFACQNEKPFPPEALSKGKEYALAAKKELGGQLMAALSKGGTIYALDYCNVNATQITDDVSSGIDVKIRRASDLNRNAANAATKDEITYIQAAKVSLKTGQELKPEIRRLNNRIVGYYPIMTNGMCLQCHGTVGKEVLPETLEKIQTLYPMDKALGYGVNELRGIWVIEMEETLFDAGN